MFSLKVSYALLAVSAVLTALGWLLARKGRLLPGCGSGSSCDAVTASRWGVVGSVPVARLGFGVYLVTLCSEIVLHLHIAEVISVEWGRWAAWVFVMASAGAASAGLWFIGLQAIVLRRFCLYCTLAHMLAVVLGVAAWLYLPAQRLAVVWGVSSTAAFILLQLLLPARQWEEQAISGMSLGEETPAETPSTAQAIDGKPASLQTVGGDPVAAGAADPEIAVGPASEPGFADRVSTERQIVLAGGGLKLRLSDWPLHGRADAVPALL